MRILIILLIAGLCLVAAKYIPNDSTLTNSALHRVRRSDSSESDSNTASVERDDSSNNNDNEDEEDNDSAERKVSEEENKLREKEEKKKQKLLEKIEKEKQKEIEGKRKLEEKLAKEQRKVQDKIEKEERKLQERLEKEKQKLEQEKRKEEQKLEKEERKREEKLKKKLEKLQKDQKESAEDTYLETEEEDSVEMEDIWKTYVYDKYGLSVTSTKLERQAALQRYLLEEVGIHANSTKSERRQAIIKLIQTKLQNDSAAIDSFRNLLLSHVNAVQIQKLKSQFENDLEELNNQTELLKNISLPSATVAQQNVEEKKTFLLTIAQFLSNIIPNWFTSGQNSSNSTQWNNNGVSVNSGAQPNSSISNGVSISEQPLETVASNDNTTLINIDAGKESNLNVLPYDVGSGSSLNNPIDVTGSSGSDPLINNAPVEKNKINGVPSDLSNAPVPVNPGLPSSNTSESVGSVHDSELNVDEQPLVTDVSALSNSNSLNGSVESVTSNLLGSNGSLNSNVSVSQADINGQFSNTDQSTISESTSSNPSDLNGSVGSNSVNNNVPVSKINTNGLSSSANDLPNVDLSNTPAAPTFELTSNNSLGLNESVNSDSLNDNSSVSLLDINGQSANTDNFTNSRSTSVIFEPTSKNPSEVQEPVDIGSINNNVSVSNDLVSGTTNTVNTDLPNTFAPSNSELPFGNPSEPDDSVVGGSLNNLVKETQVNDKIDTPVNVGLLNPPTSANATNLLVNNETISSNNLDIANQSAGEKLLSNTGVLNVPLPSNGNSLNTSGNPLQPNESSDNISYTNVVIPESESTTIDAEAVSSSSLDVPALPATNEPTADGFQENIEIGRQVNVIGGDPNASALLNLDLNLSGNNSPNKSEAILIPAEPTLLPTLELLNASSDTTSPSSEPEQISNASSIPTLSDDNIPAEIPTVSIISNGKYEAPVENGIANVNKSLTSLTDEIVPIESIVGVDINNEPTSSTNISNIATLDKVVPVSDVNSISSDNTISAVTIVNNDLLSPLNNSNLSTTISDDLVTSNLETITDGASINVQGVYKDPSSQGRNIVDVEVSTTEENAGINGQTTDTPAIPVVEVKDVIQVETQTEQGTLIVQDIVNTPNDVVTVASVQGPLFSLPLGINIPVERAASIVDVMYKNIS